MTTWSPEQERALKAVDDWWRDPNKNQVFRLFGYAGTGKTTLAKHIAQNIDGKVVFAAYTGKAALVLRQKGCDNATTIHQLIYHPHEKSKLRLRELEAELAKLRDAGIRNSDRTEQLEKEIRIESKNIARPAFSLNTESKIMEADLVVIDEVSMVDAEMGEDLKYFGVPILVIGDPFQLPPVTASTGYFTNHPADFMLHEIHRQAADNPIIHLATKVRFDGVKSLVPGSYGDSKIITQAMVGDMIYADQILCGTNKQRHYINNRVRGLKGRAGPNPVPGDRVVCLKNNHKLGLMNGSLWDIDHIGDIDQDTITFDLRNPDNPDQIVDSVCAHMFGFVNDDPSKSIHPDHKNMAEEFTYGYGLTVHKAQGSQWNDVTLYDQSWVFRESMAQWLYTGITRAAERITIIQ